LREIYQQISPSNEQDIMTRVDSDGSFDRLFSKPWSLNWSGNGRYRDSNRSSTAADYHAPQGYLYRLILAGNITERTSLNAGRFIPFELPGLGYVDGAKVHYKANSRLQYGAMAGARPDRETLGFSGDEVMGASYIAYQNGRPGALFFSGTLGVLRTTYLGKPDELAVLYDHRSDLTRFFNLSVTSQVDFNGGTAKVNKDPRLTRLDAYLTSKLLEFLSLRGGVNHYERPDTAAERAISGDDNLDAIRNSGSWRYSGGSTQNLPFRLSLDEEMTYYDTNEGRSKGFWRVSLSRYGLFSIQQGRVTLSGFNLSEFEGEGHGGQVSLSLPFSNNHFWFDSIYGFRYSGPTGEKKTYSTSDISTRLIYRTGKHWDVDLGFSRIYQQGIQSSVGDIGISYQW
jgi:hypothetical protein